MAEQGLTNDATPDIKGTAEAGSTVTIYVDGASVGTLQLMVLVTILHLHQEQMVLIRWLLQRLTRRGNTSGMGAVMNFTVDTRLQLLRVLLLLSILLMITHQM
ncbi:hypothetical protein [Chitinophaga pinensis]|uniref:Uncharacterized protein n=1 Tax=Chitinophaga pinensis TaxID=79329 RepID=A0A5C6LK10_9BACT|nr:hypothetical protein [Chitinophaga pinensis]TWV91725.1 hypothetical protein FEF09_28735 [Chitinophaga pinensis]